MLEINYRIKVFYQAAKDLSFTKASKELYISQPAVSKHIQELEQTIGQALFLRSGNRLELTEAGHTLMESADVIMKEYELLDYKLGMLKQEVVGHLTLGASTTISQYILPKWIASFIDRYPDIDLKLFSGNTSQVEEWLMDRKIGLGFVEGLAENKSLKYTPILEDKIVMFARPGNPIFERETISVDTLKKHRFIFREHGSGTNNIVFRHLKTFGVAARELINKVQMSSSESIKQYVSLSDTIGIMSVHAVREEIANGTLREVEMDGFQIRRSFYMVHLHGEVSGLPERFVKYLKKLRMPGSITNT